MQERGCRQPPVPIAPGSHLQHRRPACLAERPLLLLWLFLHIATSTSTLYTKYTYDPLKRALSTGNVVGTTTNLYAKWTTTTTDPNGNIKDYVLDAYGNMAQRR